MKQNFFRLLTFSLLLVSLTGCGSKDDVYVLTYFRQRYPTRIEIDSQGNIVEVPLPNPMLEAKLHVALSDDGKHWTPLNDNKPVWDHWMRDPYVRRGPDGVWRILSTGGGGSREDRIKYGPNCLYMTSKDMIHFQDEGLLYLMKDVKRIAEDGKEQMVRNIWAPEWFYDEASGKYMLLWSSSFERAGWMKSQLWYCWTEDFKTFTPAQVLFSPGYSVIDGTIQKEGDKYYLFYKEEMFGEEYGERRAIRMAVADRPEGPYTEIPGPLNGGQIVPVITEGPTITPRKDGKGWFLYYDYCMTDRFGLSSSDNLKDWTIEEDVNFPPEARHGCISIISKKEALSLKGAFGYPEAE